MISQLKNSNGVPKDGGKKFKPIKIPVKTAVPVATTSVNHPVQASRREDENKNPTQQSKIKTKMAHSSDDKKVKNKQSIVTELLKEGYIQSFIDMFYLTHDCLPNVLVSNNYFGEVINSADSEELAQADIAFLGELSNNLRKAESHSFYHEADKELAMNDYSTLAYTYEDQGDYVTAAYFYKKVIELAQASKSKKFEVVAMVGFGKCFDQEKKTEKAIEMLEEAIVCAHDVEGHERQSLIKSISRDLIDIYMKIAEEHERDPEGYTDALHYYEKCLEVAKRAKQEDSEGKICYKIGELYYKNQDYAKSVKYQEKYLDVIRLHMEETRKTTEEGKEKTESSMKSKTMEAHASLAKCYLKMKEIALAQSHLNQYNQLAKELKVQNALADSSYYLGKLYEQKGNSQKSIEFYKAYFEAAKSERPEKKNRALVDKSRVTYAIAKANENMSKYIGIFSGPNSLKDVLDWKIKKELK